jgi:hypothetical protein
LEKVEKKDNTVSLATKRRREKKTARDMREGIEEKPFFFLNKTIIS